MQSLTHPSELLLAQSLNLYANRLATASADHRLRIYDLSPTTSIWTLTDTWRPHTAAITSVCWNGPLSSPSSILGSIAEDGLFKLWAEDVAQAPRSGRRFKCIMTLASKTRLPWCSMGFKNVGVDTFLGLVSYDGNFSVLEPRDQQDLGGEWVDWMAERDIWIVEPPPHRSQETGFALSWHPDPLPCWGALAAGFDAKGLSVAVAAMDVVKVFRTLTAEKRVVCVAVLDGAGDVIRDVCWAAGSVRGVDTIASGCKDGGLRVYEVSTVPGEGAATQIMRRASRGLEERRDSRDKGKRGASSGIGASLAGKAQMDGRESIEERGPGNLKHKVKLVDELFPHEGAVWRVSFTDDGNVLSSTGDDLVTISYKRGLDGHWQETAEVEFRKIPSAD